MKSFFWIFIVITFLSFTSFNTIQDTLTAVDIIRKMDENFQGETSIAEVKMTIQRKTWSRDITMKFWSKGEEFNLILITAPARDKGTAFLKRGKEIWNWQPTIDQVIKLPPSMMMQSWMGSDFTNDDLVRESSFISDFASRIVKDSTIDERVCYKIEMIPNEDAAVVWGKINIWVDKKDYLQLRAEFYDDDGYLVNIMQSGDVKMMGGRLIPTKMEMIPAEEPDQKTVLTYVSMEFDTPLDDDFFSIQNMKRIK